MTKTTTPPEAPSFIDQVDATTDPVSLLALLPAATTRTETEYLWNAIARANASEIGADLDKRITRYRQSGEVITALTRTVINTGGAKDTKGNVRQPLASDQAVTFADVRDALGVRSSNDSWTPLGGDPVKRTECQRYWEATFVGAHDIDAAKLALAGTTRGNSAGTIIDEAAKIRRDAIKLASMSATERVAQADKDQAREQARTEREQVAKRATERETQARHPDAGGESLLAEILLAEASLADLLATADAIASAIATHHKVAEATLATERDQADMLAKLAAARGVSVDEMEQVLASLPAAS